MVLIKIKISRYNICFLKIELINKIILILIYLILRNNFFIFNYLRKVIFLEDYLFKEYITDNFNNI